MWSHAFGMHGLLQLNSRQPKPWLAGQLAGLQ